MRSSLVRAPSLTAWRGPLLCHNEGAARAAWVLAPSRALARVLPQSSSHHGLRTLCCTHTRLVLTVLPAPTCCAVQHVRPCLRGPRSPAIVPCCLHPRKPVLLESFVRCLVVAPLCNRCRRAAVQTTRVGGGIAVLTSLRALAALANALPPCKACVACAAVAAWWLRRCATVAAVPLYKLLV